MSEVPEKPTDAAGGSNHGDEEEGEEEEEYLIEIEEDPCDNIAFIFLKPTAQSDSVMALFEKLLRDRNVQVLSKGEKACKEAAEKGVIEKHHSIKARFAMKTPSARVRHPEDIEASFLEKLGGKYGELTKAGKLINAAEAMEKFGCTATELSELWFKEDNGPVLNITFELDVRKITSKEDIFVINGFYPALKESLSRADDKIIWFSVSWPEQSLTWKDFRTDVIGHRDPAKAKAGSFRALLNEEWSSLGLASAPTIINNGIHCSSSPLEALVERSLWADIPFGKDPLGTIIRERYSDNGVELCRQWMENNRISMNGAAYRPTYEEVEDSQTSEFLDAISQNVANDEAFLLFRAKRKAMVDLERSRGGESDAKEETVGLEGGGGGDGDKGGEESAKEAAAADTKKEEGADGKKEDGKAVEVGGNADKKDGDEAVEVGGNADKKDGDDDGTNKDLAIGVAAVAGVAVVGGGVAAVVASNKDDDGAQSKPDGQEGDLASAKSPDASALKSEGTSDNEDKSENTSVHKGGASSRKGRGSIVAFGGDDSNLTHSASPAKTLHSRKSFIRVTTIAKDDDDRWVDTDFKKSHDEMCESRWTRISSLYPGPQPGDALLPEGMRIEHVAHGSVEDSFFYVSLSALLAHPGLVQHAFLTKEVRKDGRYTFQFYRWDRWEKVEIDDTIMLNEDGQTMFCYSPTNHWWPLLLEKAYAKFYNSYDNILNGSVVEAMHDFTSKPVINMGLNEEFRMRINFQSTADWRDLGKNLLENKYAATVVAHLKEEEMTVAGTGIRAADSYGVRRIIVLPSSTIKGEAEKKVEEEDAEKKVEDVEGKGEEEEEDYSSILVELYCPYRLTEYTGPWAASDTSKWTEEMITAVKPVFKQDAPPEENAQALIEHRQLITNTIYVPLDLILANFKSLQVCYLGAVKPRPFYYTDSWAEETAGGNANFAQWRTNPKYITKNESDHPITIIATIKQHDQRSKLADGNDVDNTIKYLSCGMTLVQQNPPAAPPREVEVDSDDEKAADGEKKAEVVPAPIAHYIHTPFITSATCKFLHRGVYINQRDVSNEIIIPPHSLCYLVPATIDAGTPGNFMLTVFVPDEAEESDITVGPLEPYVDISRPLQCSFAMKVNQRVKLSLQLGTSIMQAFDPVKGSSRAERAEIHVMLKQDKQESKEGVVGDTVMSEYFALAVHDPHNARLPGSMTSALNYKEMSLLLRASSTKGTYTIVAICAKAPNPEEELPVTVTVLLPGECFPRGGDATLSIQTNPLPKPLEEDEEDFMDASSGRAFGEFSPSTDVSPTRQHPEVRSNSIKERPRRRSSRASSIGEKEPAPPGSSNPNSPDKSPRRSPQPPALASGSDDDASNKSPQPKPIEPTPPPAAKPVEPTPPPAAKPVAKAPAGKKTVAPAPKASPAKTASPPKKSAPSGSPSRPKVPPAAKK